MSSTKFLLTALVLIAVFSSAFASNSTLSFPKIRTKRHLYFQNGTRILFRVLTKDNIIKVNQIFAHGWGFRANIDVTQPPIPHQHRHHQVRRREVLGTIEQMLIQHGLNGRACIFKMFCDTQSEDYPDTGMFSKLFKLIFTHKEAEYEGVKTHKLSTRECKLLNHHCPLSLLELSPYTDV